MQKIIVPGVNKIMQEYGNRTAQIINDLKMRKTTKENNNVKQQPINQYVKYIKQ